jgi:hypothetical protein
VPRRRVDDFIVLLVFVKSRNLFQDEEFISTLVVSMRKAESGEAIITVAG